MLVEWTATNAELAASSFSDSIEGVGWLEAADKLNSQFRRIAKDSYRKGNIGESEVVIENASPSESECTQSGCILSGETRSEADDQNLWFALQTK
jgi:hypothetical protein